MTLAGRTLAAFLLLFMLQGVAHAQLFLNVNKSFNPINLSIGQTSSMVITFANTSPGTSATAIAGTDTLPAGLALVNNGVGTCSIASVASALFSAGARLNWSGGIIPPASTCTITATVTPYSSGTWVNTIPPANVLGFVGTATVSGFSTASATVTANGSFAAISGSKTVSGAVIHGGGTRSYTITLNNPNAIPLSGVGYTDTLNAALRVSIGGGLLSNTCGGVVTNNLGAALADGAAGIRLSGGTMAANGSCALTFEVRLSDSVTPQVTAAVANSIPISGVTTTLGITNAAAIAVNVRVERGVTVTKSFLQTPIIAPGTSTLQISITNYNLASIPGAGLTDTFPVGVLGFLPASASANCGAPTVTVNAGNVVVSNATLAAAPLPNSNGGGVCTIQLVVSAAAAGSYANTIPNGTFTGGFTYVASNATLTVNNPPAAISGTKTFAPVSVPQDGTSLMTITLRNTGLTAATNTSFTDNILSTMGGSITIAASPAPVTGCGGLLVANPGSTTFSLTGGSIPAAGSCTLTLPLVVAGNAATGARTNSIPAGGVTTDLGTNTLAITGTLTITADVAVTKAFNPASVPQTGTSVLTITLTNAAGGANAGITTFTETLASMGAGNTITILATPAPTNNCGGTLSAVAGSTTIALTGGTIISGGNCQLTIAVGVDARVTAGNKTNTINAGALVTNQGNNPNAASAVLAVTNALTVAKAFNPTTIGASQVSRLTVTFTHANGATAFTNMGVTDNLPASHTVASPVNLFNNCGGAVTAIPGAGSFALSGAGLPAGATSCIVALDIQAPAGAGVATNTIAAGSVTTAAGVTNAAAATANLTRAVGTGVTLNKDFTPPNISGGGSSVLRVVIINPNAFALTNVSLSDAMPAGMTVFGVPGASTTCTAGAVTAVAGSTSFALTGGTVPASGNCSFQANVTSVVGGNSINTIPIGVMTSQQSVTNLNSPSATLQVLFNVNISKAFSPVVTQAGLTSALIVTVYNSNTTAVAGQTTNTLVDLLPATLQIASGVASTTCGGTLTNNLGGALAAGSAGLRLDGGSFAASSQCNLSVVVTSNPAFATGTSVNNIAASTMNTVGGATNPTPAQATVTFVANPTLTKAFNPASTIPGTAVTLTFTLSNPNSAVLFPGGLTNASFSDSLPSGVSILAPGTATGTCTGVGGNNFSAGQTSLAFSGLVIPAAGNCTVVVLVTPASAGVYVNTVTALVTAQTPSPSTPVSSATLTVLAAPTVSKIFSPSSITSGGTGTAVLTITLSNPNTTPVALATPGLLDIFPVSPASMTLYTTTGAVTSCASALVNSANGALAVGNVGIRLNGGTIAASGSCSVTVVVQVPIAGNYLNSMPAITSTNASSSVSGATALFSVVQGANLSITKSNGTTTVAAGATVSYTITVNNAGPADASGATVSDPSLPGLSCAALNCSASGGATCPSLNLGTFQSAGLSLPFFPAGGQVVFTLDCGVTATGQ